MGKLLISVLVVPLAIYSFAQVELIDGAHILQKKCELGEIISVFQKDFGIIVENNAFGKKSGDDKLNDEQCILAVETDDRRQHICWQWDWPEAFHFNVVYPETIYGHKPWFTKSTTNILPILLEELNEATIAYNVHTKAEGAYSLAVNLWFISSAPQDRKPSSHLISDEILIVLDGKGIPAEGKAISNAVSIDSKEYALYKKHKKESFGERDFFTFVSSEPQPKSKINIEPFIRHLTNKGYLTKSSHLSSISIGNEVLEGHGESCYSLDDFEVTVLKKSE